MTNYGFMTTMEKAGIEVVQTQVGDRYVIEQLVERDWRLGGEQSGHIVWTDFTPTGDGIAASLLTLRALGSAAWRTSSRSSACPRGWRTSGSGTAARSRARRSCGSAVDEENAKLEGRGRVLVRPSGTEPLVRVMVEAPDEGGEDRVRSATALSSWSRRVLGPYATTLCSPLCAASSDM